MNYAIDCRMSGKSGIGTFLDGILPFLSNGKNSLFLIGLSTIPKDFPHRENCTCMSCSIKPFTFQELFFFPKDILHYINSCDVYFTPYCNIPNGIRIPIFSTIHDVVFLDMPKIAGKIGTFIRKLFYLRAIHCSTQIFTVSQFSKSRIQSTLHCKKPIVVVYNGIPHYLETALSPKPSKNNTLIYIGNVKAHKGLTTLLAAFSIFRNSFSYDEKPTLLIVGSKDNFRTSEKNLNNYLSNTEEQGIVFTGHIDDDTLHILLTQAKLLVQPSLYEGFGIPPLEALYAGTNVIVSDIPVFKEIYNNFPVTFFHTGDIQDLCEKMKSVWNDNKNNFTIPKIYSYGKTAQVIEDTMTSNFHRQ